MSRWHSLLEYFQFPLKVMFFGVLLLGIGSTIVNTNVEFLWRADSDFTLMLSEILRYSGGFLINIFPVLVFLKLLTKNYEDSVPVILGNHHHRGTSDTFVGVQRWPLPFQFCLSYRYSSALALLALSSPFFSLRERQLLILQIIVLR